MKTSIALMMSIVPWGFLCWMIFGFETYLIGVCVQVIGSAFVVYLVETDEL